MKRRTLLAESLGALLADEPPTEAPGDVSVIRASWRAMATAFEVLLPFGTPIDAAEGAFDLIDEIEDQLSVFRDHTEISQLNARGFHEAVTLSPDVFKLIQDAAYLSRETEGAFDIATGALIKAWGFYHRQGRMPTVTEQAQAHARSGSRFLSLDETRHTVRFLREGVEINLGGIGKGYALDRVGQILCGEWSIRSALVQGGSSSALAIGGLPGDERGWPITLKHPWKPERILGTLKLKNAALGTSAATFQHFDYNGRRLGHLLDPRTGFPAEGVQQVSVVAPTATQADALSTAFYILGPEATARYCHSHPDVGVILLPADADSPLVYNLGHEVFSLLTPA
jgi:thiamine biosynthesis lipoprotein